MNDDVHLTPAQERVREALRSLEPAAADPDFRARLRDLFVSGDIAGTHAAEVAPARGVRGATPWAWLAGLRWVLVPATAAVVLVALLVLNRGPAWEVAGVEGAGTAIVDGRSVSLQARALSSAMVAGARVRLPEGAQIRLVSGDCIAIELTAGAEFTIPETPGRWFGRSVAARLDRGTVRVVTMEGFKDARLAVDTPDLSVQVSGTSLSIECVPVGTCVCVLEGEVAVTAHDGPTATVRNGFRRVVFSDRREPLDDAMLESERAGLLELKAGLAAWRARRSET